MPVQRILACEDDPSIRELMAVFLRRRGCQVEVARNGGEALRLIGAGDYDAILLDLMLPRPNGFEILEQLRTERAEILPRIIVVTASPQAMREPPAEVGGFLAKPFDLEELGAVVSRVASRLSGG